MNAAPLLKRTSGAASLDVTHRGLICRSSLGDDPLDRAFTSIPKSGIPWTTTALDHCRGKDRQHDEQDNDADGDIEHRFFNPTTRVIDRP